MAEPGGYKDEMNCTDNKLLKTLRGKSLPAGAVREGFTQEVRLHRVLKRVGSCGEVTQGEGNTPGGRKWAKPKRRTPQVLQMRFQNAEDSGAGWSTGSRPMKGFEPRSVAETQKHMNI